jgi:pimeloyl-ACP methyl ester carboxylesterase
VAIWLAANYPEKFNKLILVDSAGVKPTRTLKYYVKVAIAKIGKNVLSFSFLGKHGEILLNSLYRLIGSKDYQQQTGIMRATLVKVVNEDLRYFLIKINAPTLLIWGENDKDVPLSSAKVMETAIHDAGLVVLKDAGHFSYLDKFSDFCLIVSEFFRSANANGAENNG